MSHYLGWAIHPDTRVPTRCTYLDDYFGRHCYGVRFEGEVQVFPEGLVKSCKQPGGDAMKGEP